MAQSANSQTLLAGAEKSLQSLESLSELLNAAENLGKNGNGSANPEHLLLGIQRKVLLDSFTVKKFHRDYKEWENGQKDQFLAKEVKPYNQKYAQMSRVYNDFEQSETAFEEFRKTTQIPAFDFSIQTIQKYENGSLLKYVQKTANGHYPSKVALSSLFSLDADSKLPAPCFSVFNKLVNLEFRLRMLLHIKHEVLLRAKAHLSAKNIQWASRDAKLNSFLTTDFNKVHQEISKIKASEHEDLKYYEEELDDEEVEEEEEEEEEDHEENEEIAENIDENVDAEGVDVEVQDKDKDKDKETEEPGENTGVPLEEDAGKTTENMVEPENGHLDENEDAAENMDSEMAEPVPEEDLSKQDLAQPSTEIVNGEKEDMELD